MTWIQAPRLLIGAPKSGSGKTLITCGLLEAFARRGLRPVSCKCGPDYIDPMFHKYVLGIPGRNLDSFFLGEEEVREALRRLIIGRQAGIAVIEGVMGYYDGIGGNSDRASTWEIARMTASPAVLAVDGRGASLSVAALLSGFAHFRKDSRIAGVILNRVREQTFKNLAPAIERETGLPVFGYVPQSGDYAIESRHLGLFLPGETEALRERIGRLADQMERTVDVEALIRLAGRAERLQESGRADMPQAAGRPEILRADGRADMPQGESGHMPCRVWRDRSGRPEEEADTGEKRRLRIGVARDEAFCFYYQENLELLEQMGAELVPFSPLRDTALPENVCGLILGGGYPENYAAGLALNEAMREEIGAAARAGMPMLAECGGFLYLHRTLEGSDGKDYPMAGAVDAAAFRGAGLSRFGYVTLTSPEGLTIRGHEFHYWDSGSPGTDWEAKKPSGDRKWRCMRQRPGIRGKGRGEFAAAAQIWGFPHLYYPSNPQFAAGWLAACGEFGEREASDSRNPAD